VVTAGEGEIVLIGYRIFMYRCDLEKQRMKRQLREMFVADGYKHVLNGEEKSDSQLALDFCGEESCRPGQYFGPVARDVNIIHAVTDGQGILRTDEQMWELKKGSVFLLPQGKKIFYQADKKNPWSYCWIGFHGTLAHSYLRAMGFSKDNLSIQINNLQKFQDSISRLMQYPEISIEDSLMRTGILHEICSVIMSGNCHPEQIRKLETSVYSYSEYALRFMNIHFRETISVSTLAEKIGISRGYLYRIIKEAVGLSPQEYLMQTRLTYAIHLIAHSSESISEIASASGFYDALEFSKIFKRRFSISPSQFRRRYRTGLISEEDLLNHRADSSM